MTFKEKAVEALYNAAAEEKGNARKTIKLCAEMVDGLPDDGHKNIPCAAPNYEAMYHAAQVELQEQKKVCEDMACQLRAMQLCNSRLTGYREAVERILGEGV